MSEPKRDGPEWVPYQPPPPSGGERVWRMVQRAAFPVILVLFVVGLAALLYVAPDFGTQGQSFRQLIGLDPAPSSTPAARPQPPQPDTMPGSAEALRTEPDSTASDGMLGTGYANLSVYSEPVGATVLVDGDSIGATPLNRYPIRSGVYIITVERDSFFAADTVAVLRNNQAPTYAVTLNPRPDLPNEDLAAQRRDASNASSSATSSGSSGNASSTGSATTQPPPTAPPPAPEPTTGTLQLTSTPAGAQVELDGTVVGTTPLTLNDVEAGAHEVAFTQSGYETMRTNVTVTAGQARQLTAALTPQMGQLRVLPRPWGTIYVDGELRERNADVWYEMPIAAGEYEITVVHPALGRQTRTVTVSAGEQLSVVVDLRNPPPSSSQADTTQAGSSNRSS